VQPKGLGHFRFRRPWLAAVGTAIAAILAAGPAGAGDVTPVGATRVVSATAQSSGPVEIDSDGRGYVTWVGTARHGGDPVMFCRVPRSGTCTHPVALPLPAHATWDRYGLLQPFPVLGGDAGVVLVVDPSYLYDTTAVWTSHDGGASFGGLQVIPPGSYANCTGIDDVLRAPDPYRSVNGFSMASHNPGLGYSFTSVGAIGARNPPAAFKFDTDRVPGDVDAATVGSSGQETIEAFGTDADRPRLAYFWSPLPGVSGSPGSLEHGPTIVGIGVDPRLAGGPKGLVLLSLDAGATPSRPERLDVRRWDATTHTFGSPSLIATTAQGIDASDEGGITEDTATGALTVAWPSVASHGAVVMRVWSARAGSTTFGPATTVGTIDGYTGGPARLAVRDGRGFLTWQDEGGLRLVDLTGR
jgi:hypothetical protein